jgi:hypothetical protein
MHSTHAANAPAGKHGAIEHSTSKMTGMDHHHHHLFRREPVNDEEVFPQYFQTCIRMPDLIRPWSDCNGPTKSATGARRRS